MLRHCTDHINKQEDRQAGLLQRKLGKNLNTISDFLIKFSDNLHRLYAPAVIFLLGLGRTISSHQGSLLIQTKVKVKALVRPR